MEVVTSPNFDLKLNQSLQSNTIEDYQKQYPTKNVSEQRWKLIRQYLEDLGCKEKCIGDICESLDYEDEDDILSTLFNFIYIVDDAKTTIEIRYPSRKMGKFDLMYGSGPDLQATWENLFSMGMWFDSEKVEFDSYSFRANCKTLDESIKWFIENFPGCLLEE